MMKISNTPSGLDKLVKLLCAQQDKISMDTNRFNTSSKRYTKDFGASSHTEKCDGPNTNRRSSNVVLLAVLVCLLSSLVTPVQSDPRRPVGVCNGIPCANGGKLLVSNSIWGNCRCKCPSGFVGPYCQYQAVRKRSVDTTAADDARERAEILERIRQRLLQMSKRLREEMEAEATYKRTDEVVEASRISKRSLTPKGLDGDEAWIHKQTMSLRSLLSTMR